MRVFLALTFIAGLMFLLCGSELQYPVKSATAVCMVLLGVYTMVASCVGLVGSFQRPRWLVAFIIMQVGSTFERHTGT